MKTAYLIFFLGLPMISDCQTYPNGARFGLTAGGGLGYSYLRHGIGFDGFSMRTGYSVAASATYGDIPLVQSTALELSLQASFHQVTSGHVQSFGTTAEFSKRQMSLMLWPKLLVSGTVTPFIEAGIGVGSVKFHETYSAGWPEDGGATSTALSLGVGGGVSFPLSEAGRLEAYSQTIYSMKDVAIESSRNSFTFPTPAVWIIAFRINFLL